MDFRPTHRLTREEAARFMVEFAKNVLCRKKTRVYNSHFSDITQADATLHSFIEESYEYEIFNGDRDFDQDGITTFRPKDIITDDELAAIMVRLVTHNMFRDQVFGENRATLYRTKLAEYVNTSLNSK